MLAELRPTLSVLSRRLASQCDEDALQEAEIAVWHAMPGVDLSRPSTVRSFLVKAGVNAMRDAVRSCLRAGRTEATDTLDAREAPARPEGVADYELTGILAEYVEAVIELGDTYGMHKLVVNRRDSSMPVVTAAFHRAVRLARHQARVNGWR